MSGLEREPAVVNLNGQLVPAAEARVGVFEHGLLYGDGLFETLRVYGGRFFRLDAHLDRLEASAAQIELPLPWGRAALATALRQTVAANGISEGAVRLTVTRGEGPPVPDPTACGEPAYFVTARAWSPPEDAAFERGLALCFAGDHSRWIVPGVKSLSYLPFQQARQTARRRGFDDGVLFWGERVVETGISNLFVVVDGRLLTPPLSTGCLPGVTRAAVLELAAGLGIRCGEAELKREQLLACDECFVTNSLLELSPVGRVEDTVVGDGGPGPETRRLRGAYRELVVQELEA